MFLSNNIKSQVAPSFLPSIGVLEMTYSCNHRCRYCSCPWEAPDRKYERRKELTPSGWQNCITKLFKMGVSSLAFTGGEPLLNEHLFQIMEFAAKQKVIHIETVNDSLVSSYKPPKLYLLSNGRLVDDRSLELCSRHGINLSMSLPGLRTYAEHTGSGEPTHVLNMFKRAKASGVSTTVNITVTKKNLFELYENIGEALIAGADTVLLNRFLPGGRGLSHVSELMLTADEVNEMVEVAEDVLKTANRFGSIGTELPQCLIKKSDFVHLKIGTRCAAAKDFFVVGPSGYIRVCNHSPVELEHISNIDELKDDPYWKKFAFSEYLPDMCKDCHLIGKCDGGCREVANIVYGNASAADPLFNKRA